MRTRPVLLLLTFAAVCTLPALAGVARPTAAAFTASAAVAGNRVTVDTLGNYFRVEPGAATRAGSATAVAVGAVDTLTLGFGFVPSARAFADVFRVTNVSAVPRVASLEVAGLPQVASALFAASGAATATLAPGASSAVTVTTSAAVAGKASGTIRLRVDGSRWLYRDYPTTIEQAPGAAQSAAATARAAGRIALGWGASSTTTNLAGYHVYRSSAGGALTRITPTPVAATSLEDTATVDGTVYTYVVRAVSTDGLESLDSPGAAATADATAPARPDAVSVAAAVNAAGAGSVSVTVPLPASSLASDSVTVVLGDGSRSVTKTVAALMGGGTLTVSGIDATSLADGALSVRATAADAAGNVSAAATGSASKDTVAPAAPTAAYTRGASSDTISGSAEAASTVRAVQTLPSAAGPYAATAGATGAYSVGVPGAKNNVSVTYSVTATDAAGNTSTATVVIAAAVGGGARSES